MVKKLSEMKPGDVGTVVAINKIGIRRTGISKTYKGEILQKDKSRKTNNTSKKSHIKNNNIQLSLFDI